MTNYRRLLTGLAIVATPFNLAFTLDSTVKSEEVAGKIVEVKGSAYIKKKRDAVPVLLDPVRSTGLKLHAGESIRCDPGSTLRVELYGEEIPIPPSYNFYPIPRVPVYLPSSGEKKPGGGIGALPNSRGAEQYSGVKETHGKLADRSDRADREPVASTGKTKDASTGDTSKDERAKKELSREDREDFAFRRSADATASLYARLGGMPVLNAVVEEFVGILALDIRISAPIRDLKADQLASFKAALVEQLCAASDGPCMRGDSQKSALPHFQAQSRFTNAGVPIRRVEGYSIIEDLREAFDRLKVDETTQAVLFLRLFREPPAK